MNDSVPARRIAAAVIDLLAMGGFAVGAGIATFLVYMKVTNDDFDGPGEYETLFDWAATGWLGAYGMLYGLAEPLLHASPGKWLLGLRVAPATESPLSRRRGLLRWAVKFFPLAILCGVAWFSYERLDDNLPWNMPTWEPDRFYWLDDLLSELAIVVVATTIAAALLGAALGGGRPLHDRVARTRVIRFVKPLDVVRGSRGFEPIITPMAAVARDE